MSVRVVAPCRLHFGLFHVPVEGLTHWRPDGPPVRRFGGVGLMIDTPAVTVDVRASSEWSAVGPHAARGLAFVRAVDEVVCGGRGLLTPPLHVWTDGPPQHVGFGVGTALGMAAGWAVWCERFQPHAAPAALGHIAEATGRGRRSGIGVHGFGSGGLIMDQGKVGDELPSLGDRLRFPPGWRAILVRPPSDTVWCGESERVAFGRHRTPEEALSTTSRLLDIAVSRLVPAVRGFDFDAFAAAVFEYNRTAGEPFAADQGGPYAGPAVSGVIDELLEWGVQGVGQSSWGPTVFAFARDPDEADHIARRARDWLPASADVTVTAANNTGARLERLE